MRRLALLTLLSSSIWAQAPVITAYTSGVPGDTQYGPGTFLIVFGTFTTPSAGRDYTITVGGASSGINVAANGVFIAATIPPNTPPGTTTLVITYQGNASNALPITISALAPAFQGVGYSVTGSQAPPGITFNPFTHYNTLSNVTPVSPAALNEIIEAQITGIGASVAPAVTPTVTVGGLSAQIVNISAGSGYETIYFVVPSKAAAGIDPVIVTVGAASTLPANLPVGITPAIGYILNGASFASSNVVAAGSIVSLFGANFGSQSNLSAFPSTAVDGVSVLFGTTPVPIFALAGSGGQINVLVPTELGSSGTVNVTVQTPTGTSPPLPVTLAPAAPGIFYYGDPLLPSRHNAVAVTANTAWIAMPASEAASYGLSTNCKALGAAALCATPATRGGYLQIYVTGLGKATPNADPNGAVLPTGTVAPISGNPLYETLLTPTVTLGGVSAPVLFSGIGPGYNGLYVIDVQIPANITPGNDVPLAISIGGATDTATVAIQ